MKNSFRFILAFLLIGILVSCEKNTQVTNEEQTLQSNRLKSASVNGGLEYTYGVDSTLAFCGTPVEATFQTYGKVKIINNADSLFIQIKFTNRWQLRWVSIFVGDEANMLVGTDGYPDYYNWPTFTEFNPYPSEVTLKFSFNDIPECGKIFIKIYSVRPDAETGEILGREIAWVSGLQYGSHDAYYNNYCKQTCCVIEDVKYNLVAGKHTTVGDVTVTNDDDNLYVTYNTKDGWSLKETHLYVGTYQGLPKNRHGIPVPGKFPYKASHVYGTTSYIYTIPLKDIATFNSCLIVAAHSEVVKKIGKCIKSETAWSAGKSFSCRRWGWFSSYCIQKCEVSE
jgi:hypothetical protein